MKRGKPLKRTGGLKRSGISPVSSKRKGDMVVYTKLRKDLLSRFPTCQVCGISWSTDCHHKAKRGKHYLDESTLLAVCRRCHREIHDRPSWARENGYLIDLR